MRYEKAALSYEQQLELLLERGLEIESKQVAMHWLERIGYYRLSAYFLPFKVRGIDQFRRGATFRMVLDLYQFDARLRLLSMQAIDLIEVSVRAALTYRLAHAGGPFGYADPSAFAPGFDHSGLMSKLRQEMGSSREDFVAHYRRRYAEERYLPIWMATELLTFGTMSKMVAGVPAHMRKRLAQSYGISERHLTSWLRCLAYVRNVCAHHGRLWNRELSLRPEMLREWGYSGFSRGTCLRCLPGAASPSPTYSS